MLSDPSTGPRLSTARPAVPAQSTWSSALLYLVILGSIFYAIVPVSNYSRPPTVTAEARIIEIRSYPPSRDGTKPRLWLKFEFETDAGKRVVGSRKMRVTSPNSVAIGDRITINYRKRRPKHARIVSLRAPPSEVAGTPAPSGRSIVSSLLGGVLFVPLLVLAFFIFRWRARHRTSPKQTNVPSPWPNRESGRPPGHQDVPDAGRETSQTHLQARPADSGRPERTRSRPTPVAAKRPRKKSKVIQRGSWI